MAGHPSDVGSTPVNVVFFEIKDPFRSEICADRISARRMHEPFRLARRSRGVKDVERVFGIEWLGWTIVRRFFHQLVPPVIASWLPIYWRSPSLCNKHR